MNTDTSKALVPAGAPISKRAERQRFINAFKRVDPSTPYHQDHCVKIVIPRGWGMQELEVLVQPDIGVAAFEKIDRNIQHEEMKAYFNSEIKIVPQRGKHALLPDVTLGGDIARFFAWFMAAGLVALMAPLVFVAATTQNWLLGGVAAGIALGSIGAYRFLTGLLRQLVNDRIWPGMMEERLAATIQQKFCHTDVPIRHVIDRYADVFVDNNWMFLRLKRLLQAVAIAALYLAIAPGVYLALIAPAQLTLTALGLCAGWAVAVAIAVAWTFNGLNDHIYDNKYLQTLQNSAQHVSTLVRNRMASIYSLYQHTLRHVTELQVKGEPTRGVKDDVRVIDDIALIDHEGFFAVQTMIWLAKRNEYIELHLHNRLHLVLTIQAVLSVAGFVSCLAIFLMGAAPAIMLSYYAVAHATAGALPGFEGLSISAVTIAGSILIIAVSAWLSWESYFEESWNPLKTRISNSSILDEHFDTSDLGGWQTYRKIGLDVNLAGAYQKTLGVVSDLFQALGSRPQR